MLQARSISQQTLTHALTHGLAGPSLILALALACSGGGDAATTTDDSTTTAGSTSMGTTNAITTATPTTTTTPTSDSTSESTSESTSTSETGTTGVDCPPGTEDCPCDAATCQDPLVCTDGVCAQPPPPACGDGVINGADECDDGANNGDTLACKSDCTLQACGDGFLGIGEGCDDGNEIDDDECSNTCIPASCGDTVVQAPEQCDDGNAVNTDECLDTCASASCGDSFVQAGVEACDDGNLDATDACTSECKDAVCGDTFVQADVEECDDGNADNTDECVTGCNAAACGDTFVQAGVEQCDDGNAINTDACVMGCKAAACGDTFLQGGVEQCDDGNMINNDGCSSTCKLEVYELAFEDKSGSDDIAESGVLDFFNAIPDPKPSDFILVSVLGAGVPNGGAWCSSNGDFYVAQYITNFGNPVAPNSGAWDKWSSLDGVNWSGTQNAGYTNYYSGACDGVNGSWCSEWGIAPQGLYLGIFPGRPDSESYAGNFNGSTTNVKIRYGGVRMTVCGF